MFTVKWIVKTSDGEITRMYEAEEIAFACRNHLPPYEGMASPLKHWLVADRSVENQSLFILNPYSPNYGGRSFDVGIVYVMNENGATVGKYHLRDEVITDLQAEPLVKAA